MVTLRGDPIILLNLYLDDGIRHLAAKTTTYKDVAFTARVVSWGRVDRSVSTPPGTVQVDDAIVEIADTDGQVREWFNQFTPFRRIGEIIFDFEPNHTNYRNSPVRENFNINIRPDPLWKPLFTGEVVPGGVDFEPGKVIVRFQEVTTSWLARSIPRLITRDNFPNLPDDVNEGADDYFAPIIFGRCYSYSATGVDPQGVIKCHHVDTKLSRYVVARHTVYAVHAVYRKTRLEARFKLVDPSEYTVVEEDITINSVDYTFTYIQFIEQQFDSTIVHADVSGADFRYDFDSGLTVTGSEVRNPVDCIMNLIYYLLADETRINRFKADNFSITRDKCDDRGYLCDGAITEAITAGQAISRLSGDFGIDFYQTNQAEITISIYDPDLDQFMHFDDSLTLLKTLKPKLGKNVFNRVRYRYYRQNAGLLEFSANSASSQWGFEETVDNVPDQTELAQNGITNPLLEKVVDLHFVRDDDVALDLMKARMGYYTLRSYVAEFELPAPEVMQYLSLTSPIAITHIGGIGYAGDGWVDEPFKLFAVGVDLKTYKTTAKGIRWVEIQDQDFECSFNGTHPAHDVQVRLPQYPTLVNGTLDGPDLNPDADPQINLNDDLPAAPADEVVTTTLIYTNFYNAYIAAGYTSGQAATAAVIAATPYTYTYRNVQWQENQTTFPRLVSGYIPLEKGSAIQSYVGTLYPDTRPTTLTVTDAYRAKFYSTDFDHEFWWTGAAWQVIHQDNDEIRWFRTAPASPGFQLCDGSANIRRSKVDGTTELITVPTLNTGAFVYGGTYSGPTPTSATAPGASSASGGAHTHGVTVSAHTHSYSSTSGSGGGHTPTTSSIIDTGHTHSVTYGGSGTTGSGGSHSHTGSTNAGTPDGSHDHAVASGPIAAPFDLDHVHGYGTLEASSAGSDHSHSISSLTLDATANISPLYDIAGEEALAVNVVSYVDDPAEVTGSASGSTDSGGTHGHSVDGETGLISGGPSEIGIGDIDVYVGSASSSHTHVISSESSHTHSFTVSSGSGTTGSANISSSLTINMTPVSDHTHSVSGTTGSDGGGSYTSSSDGAHTHTITVDATGKPLRMGLLPYIRL